MAIETRSFQPQGQYVTLGEMIEIVSALSSAGFDERTPMKVDTSLDGVFDFTDPGVYIVRVMASMRRRSPESDTSTE